ncbi:cytochrome b [Arenimonas sp. MALMAid1274]|uniref:cytochrome b n=1 Tax=Arenimonas sp. MALMAid1274 TaxID=3411630 RepID=UPI003B9EA2D4
MPPLNAAPRYSAAQRRLHWLMFLLVALAYLCIELRGSFERGSWPRATVVQSHYWIGLAVLALALPRLLLRLRRGAPPITPPLPAWQAWPSRAVHGALYAFLLAQPLLGLLTAWTDGKSVLVPFTARVVPALVAPDPAWAARLEDLHGSLGSAFYWVIGLHVLASLYHHAIRGDDTLRRMR